MKRLGFLLIALLAGLPGCGTPDALKPEQYGRWIVDPANGLIQTKEINKVSVTSRFLPSEYLAYREYTSGSGEIPFDSVWNAYKCGLSFQLIVTTDKSNSRYSNLIYYNATSAEEISARIKYLSFNISEFIQLEHKELLYEPVLSNFEGFDQLGNKVTFLVSFLIPDYQCGIPNNSLNDVRLVFTDPIWDLGTNQFEFQRETITKIPAIKR